MRATVIDRVSPSVWRVRYYRGIPDLDAHAASTLHWFQWSARLASWVFMNRRTP